MGEGPGERRLSLGEVGAGTQPTHHLDPVVVRVCESLSRTRVEEETGVHGEIDLRRGGRIHTEELCRRDADHGERHVVDENRLSDRGGRAAEAPLAVAGAQDRDRRGAGAIVVGKNETPRRGYDRQPAEEAAGDVLALRELRLALDQHVQTARRLVRE